MTALSRAQEKVLRSLQGRHGRRKSPFFLCEGPRAAGEALRRQPQWIEWALIQDGAGENAIHQQLSQRGIDTCLIDPATFAQYAQTEAPQGVLLVLRRPQPDRTTTRSDPFLLVLDQVADPGNVGTILRSAWAAGLQSVCCLEGGADPFGPKAVRAGMGAQFAVELRIFADRSALRAAAAKQGVAGLWTTAATASVSCFSADFKLAHSLLVLGNEAHGVADWTGARQVRIPMPGGADSLNVAQAATVLLFEAVRRGLLPHDSGPAV